MTIKTKDWSIQNDLMPGIGGGSFRVRGTITVANPGIKPVLVKAKIQDKSFGLNLELQLEQEEGMFMQMLTDKEVCFEMSGDHSYIPWVNVIHEGEQLTTIKKVITTN
ncbi:MULTISPECIES: hypothetical protein [Pseudomonas]|uniref:Uncharacterized protein n=1 Tax=Pseudomonas sp. Hg7Tf TaxID=3236988 RepID=A0AB39HY10_9PSED|nr:MULTISPECIES: hypothetical protein [Pseudomonas]KJK06724.1 hypothetical protein UB47_14605 [Pseudomonas sp. 5]MDD1977276.1 hypothetical protein [Pseudomonas putida]MDH2560558.1 hypothetical protein [Pseudomonas sp. Hg5Tf]QYX46381.1 hypothetical protein K3F43_16960 [Pseudomonas sp. S11A 273]